MKPGNKLGPVAKKHRPRIRSLENPRVPLDPWSPLAGESGGATSSGVRVSRDSALTLAAWWRGVTLIANTIGKLPVMPYKLLDAGKTEDGDHQAHFLLTQEPNELMRPHTFKETFFGHVLNEGNGYAAIERDGVARPSALLILDPRRTEPVMAGGRLFFAHRLLDGSEMTLPAQDVFHIPGFGYDGVKGYSVIQMAAEAIGLGLATQKYGANFYKNNSRPNVVLEHPAALSKEAMKRLREDWERLYGGVDNAHRTAVLNEGMTAKALTINARDAQLAERLGFTLIDVANFLHIPPHKLGSMTNVSYGSLEQENRAFLDDCISHWLTAFSEECDAKLLTTYQRERRTHAVSFDISGLVLPDETARYAAYTQGIASGVLSQDEAREREGLNPIPGGIGAKYYRPANLVELDPADRPKPAPVATPAKDEGGNPTPAPKPSPRPAAKKPKRGRRYSEDQERAPNGEFGSGSGDDDDAHAEALDALAEKHDAEDEAVGAAREKEDAATDKAREKEDAATDKARDREDKGVEKARDREDEKVGAARDKEDKGIDARREKEDDARDEAREAEDEKIEADHDAGRITDDERSAAYAEQKDRHDEEDADRSAERKAEYAEQKERWGKEDEAREAAREKEDEAREAKREAEDQARDERRDAEDAAKEAARKAEDDERAARQKAERDALAEGKRPAPAPELAAALRALVADAARRAVRKAAHRSERAAKRPAAFLAWLDALEVDADALTAPLAACRAAGIEATAPDLTARVRAALLEASGRARDADTLAAECAQALAVIDADPLGEGRGNG